MAIEESSANFGPNICLSGGADGADLMWGMCSGTAGHSVLHFSFAGHRSAVPPSEIVVLSDELLREADPYLIKANKTMHRRFPSQSPHVNNLLRRNWYQVRDAESCYAVSTIKDGIVQGGTSWAISLFQDRFDRGPCPAYVYCQEQGYWFEWTGEWTRIYEPPTPAGVWAGIGSRALNPGGKLAIRVLLNYQGVRDKHDVILNDRKTSLAAIARLGPARYFL